MSKISRLFSSFNAWRKRMILMEIRVRYENAKFTSVRLQRRINDISQNLPSYPDALTNLEYLKYSNNRLIIIVCFWAVIIMSFLACVIWNEYNHHISMLNLDTIVCLYTANTPSKCVKLIISNYLMSDYVILFCILISMKFVFSYIGNNYIKVLYVLIGVACMRLLRN